MRARPSSQALANPNGPILETSRLLLRLPSQDDFPAFAVMMADGDHVRFIGGAQLRASAWRMWATVAGSWSLLGFGMFSVIEKASGNWIGRVGPWMPDGWPAPEIGWGLIRAAAGKGFAMEAASAAMDFAFDILGWDKVIHIIAPQNTPSQALAARLGSINSGPTQMPPPLDGNIVEAWGQSAEDWRTGKR
jgi:RimJ/RimL family protein N-acetyltransferase